ncbi:MAG: PIG-L family deacetylase [Nanoarchaeota archaeon]|nr:PIG-L family deacetylase [Nanoarchaeota archaeon]
MKETIMVICAHSDDQIFGCGGSIIKYANEGNDIYTVIFSYGESSHPLMERKYAVETRVKESRRVDKFIKGKGVTFLGLYEKSMARQIKEKGIEERLKKLISQKKPDFIFTHSPSDPHPAHQICFRTVLKTVNSMNFRGNMYSFDIWNPIKIRGRRNPRLVVDITSTFHKKLKALQLFKSQRIAYITLFPLIFFSAVANGLAHDMRYAEVFLKIK